MSKKAILLVNVGTPNSPKIKDVKRYLKEFLNDGRVITLPKISRTLLVNGIIVPFRAKKSSKLYQKLWTDEGSPLLYHLEDLNGKVQSLIGDDYLVFFAMRYGEPSLKRVLDKILANNIDELVILPLYPQYASSTTGSVFEEIADILKKKETVPGIKFIHQFYDHPEFIKVFSEKILKYNPKEYDHIIFSYHGLPESHIHAIHPKINVKECTCEQKMPSHGNLCYRATCFATTRLLAKELNLHKSDYSVGFQSRLSSKWLTPFADELIKEHAAKGTKKLLVVAPSFVTDCLETIIEIEDEYQQLFIENGGHDLTLVKSLNSSSKWAEALVKICLEANT